VANMAQNSKPTKAELLEMLAEAVRNTQPEAVRKTRPAPKRTVKIKSVRASARRKSRP